MKVLSTCFKEDYNTSPTSKTLVFSQVLSNSLDVVCIEEDSFEYIVGQKRIGHYKWLDRNQLIIVERLKSLALKIYPSLQQRRPILAISFSNRFYVQRNRTLLFAVCYPNVQESDSK
ncbi:hypothetical protein CDAR_441821 [Caerostris darwini]|uniref:Uncharacterized protein n=1 Tax=Caerostris darwini TaxID=1538125 RepID=A0AAV4VX45_9ARAC|nr:hypothetical protein CDAR_441811 [Caerostris darwini]GIY75027.1 hypothetical protein CDAR_441821 [Caerostris darwini]